MDLLWAEAVSVAAIVTIAVTPLIRRAALASGSVDQPAPGKIHVAPVPYLGGVGLVAAVVVATLSTDHQLGALGVLGAAVVVAGVGLVDDRRTVDWRARLACETAVAAFVTLDGIRLAATGVEWFDAPLTVAWLVGATNAFNLIDNVDALAASAGVVTGAGLLLLAAFGDQQSTAILAAAVAGACLGFLPYNRPPASIFMGDAGSLFLGFSFALLSTRVASGLDASSRLVVPIGLLALPILDAVTVAVGRVRRRQPVWVGGTDHLSHRLRARGLGPIPVVVVLTGTHAASVTVAVLAGTGTIPACLGALGILSVMSLAALAVLRSGRAGAATAEADVPAWQQRRQPSRRRR